MSTTLASHATRLALADLAALAASRSGAPPLTAAGWKINLARQYLDDAAEACLLAHGESAGLAQAASALFSGSVVNPSEDRPALHWALRAQVAAIGEAEIVRQSLGPALAFASEVRAGQIKGAAGDPITAVVHIGIGGSDFGPRLIADAFADHAHPRIALRFAANVDPFDLDRALAGLDPATTLMIGVSKSFGTEETLYNLARARTWLGAAAAGQIVLITANPTKATAWLGSAPGRIFDMPLSVGGRFSLWSAASLACMISLGPEIFRAILSGAAGMDAHTRDAPIGANVPMRLALLDYWNASIRKSPMRVVLAYANRLRLLPTYLQQLEMESNGKSVGTDGTPVPVATAPALWGGEGSVGQHSYHQWLHQGTAPVPCEFILAPDAGRDAAGIDALTAHALAQAEVLANGRTLATVQAEEPDIADSVARQKVHAGGRPSILMSHDRFGPEAFGALVVLYEHRTYFAGRLWGINPFDQWGVERGKTMAARLLPALNAPGTAADPVTSALIRQLRGGG